MPKSRASRGLRRHANKVIARRRAEDRAVASFAAALGGDPLPEPRCDACGGLAGENSQWTVLMRPGDDLGIPKITEICSDECHEDLLAKGWNRPDAERIEAGHVWYQTLAEQAKDENSRISLKVYDLLAAASISGGDAS